MSLEKVVYTAHAKATGGRDGRATSSDGILDVKLAVPKEMGGAGGGTNPEQLFAAGYSACFLGAMKFVANRDHLKITPDVYIEGDVGIVSYSYWLWYSSDVKHSFRRFRARRSTEISRYCSYCLPIFKCDP